MLFAATSPMNSIRGRLVAAQSSVLVEASIIPARCSRRTPDEASASPRCLDGGDVDLLHGHHRLEGALGLSATGGKRIGQRARGDLPGEAPAVLAPAAGAFLAAVADDRVPVAVRLFLIVGRDLEGKGLGVLERGAAVEAETGDATAR